MVHVEAHEGDGLVGHVRREPGHQHQHDARHHAGRQPLAQDGHAEVVARIRTTVGENVAELDFNAVQRGDAGKPPAAGPLLVFCQRDYPEYWGIITG